MRELRERRGLSQQELARAAGVSRQTVSYVETGVYLPSVAVAVRMARALGVTVEELFPLQEPQSAIEAVPGGQLPVGPAVPVAVARVGAQWVAYPLACTHALGTGLAAADGVAVGALGEPARVRVQLWNEVAALERTAVVAGCAPALGVWGRIAEGLRPGLRVLHRHANSEQALRLLASGQVHVAGVHVCDWHTGECNLPVVRRLLAGRRAVVFSLGTWEEGLVVRPGNPLGLARPGDLGGGRGRVRLVNREPGSGARALLEAALREAGIPPDAVAGFHGPPAHSHQEVARAVALGAADAGVSSGAVAALFGLDFVPWRQVRYDLVVLAEHLDEAPVRELLATLADRRVRRQLEAVGGYDTRCTGEVVARTGPGWQAPA
ncbi:MAG TPA: substrate-binding domain-containing protein [Limnochordales bacterium]